MHSGLRRSRLTLRIILINASCPSCVPWEKFRRTTSTPARTRSRNTGSVLEAGPSVATIFARRWMGDSVKLNSANDIGKLQKEFDWGKGFSWVKGLLCVWSASLYMGDRSTDPLFHHARRRVQWSVRTVTDLKTRNPNVRKGNSALGVP